MAFMDGCIYGLWNDTIPVSAPEGAKAQVLVHMQKSLQQELIMTTG